MSKQRAVGLSLRATLVGAMLVAAACSEGSDAEKPSSVQEALTLAAPFRVRAIDFTAFSDSDTLHEGNCGSGPVDQQAVSDNGVTCGVGYTKPAEWLEYSLQIATAGKFNFVSRVAGNAAGKTFRLSVDGVAVGGSQPVPSTGWTAFADRQVSDVALATGTHTLRVLFETGDTNLNYIDVTPGSATLPQRIEAENYQRAAESTPTTNSGTGCNRGDGVDMGSTSDMSGGCLIGWATAGEWLEYDVTVPQPALFDFTARMASGTAGRTLQINVDGAVIGTLTSPNTGYNAFEDRKLQNVSLTAGPHVVRALFVQGDLNLNYLDISVHPVVPGFSFGGTVNYNAFVFQDLSVAPSVAGPVAAGRDVVSQGFSFNTLAAGSIGALAGRNFNGTSGNVQRDLVYGTALSLNNVTVAQGTSRKATPLDFVAEKATLDLLSSNLANFAANGSTAVSPSGTIFTFTGTDPSRNVFSVNGALLAAADQFNFTVPATSTVIVNVTGSGAVFETSSLQLGGLTAGHLLWNFPQATTLRISQTGFKGTVLATNAAVTLSSGSLDGSLLAGSATGSNGAITWQPFNGSLTVCSAPALSIVPASPQLAGTPLALSATATCADSRAAEFHYDYLNSVTDTTWHEVLAGFGTSTINWDTSNLPAGSYQVRLLVRRVGEAPLSGASAMSSFVFDNPVLIPTTAPVVQNFNGLGSAQTSAAPSGWRIDKQVNPRTVGTFTAATYKTDSTAGALLAAGSSNGIYNFGAGVANAQAANYWLNSTDRAPGWLSAGSGLGSGGTKSGNLYVALRAPVDKDLTSLNVGYDIEKYSTGTNPSGFRVQLYSSTNGTNWTNVGSDFLRSFGPNSNNLGFDPAPGQTINVAPSKLSASIPHNTLFYLAWNYTVDSATSNDGSNAAAVAIDNVSIQGSEACVPNCTGKTCGGDGCAGICGQLCTGGGCILSSDCQAGLVCTGVAQGGTAPSVCQPPGYPSTCANGVLDGNETGVDCGGSCSVCQSGGDLCPPPPWGTDPCLTYSCNPASGQISSAPKSDGVGCPDGNLCNGNELCQVGLCSPGTPKVVDDQNPCTLDNCDPSSGQVSHTAKAENTLCSDGNVCNGVELCHSGVCQAGDALVVDDGDPCTADSCDSVSGVIHEPLPEGSACGPNKTCQSGSCANVSEGPTAPPLDPNVSTTIQSSLAFLINSQAGLQPSTVIANRVALVRGRVTDRAGAPLAGVTVSIVGRPELGHTTTATSGEYNLVVNGGGFLRVSFVQSARLPAERTAQVNWNEYTLLEDVVLVGLDAAASPIDLNETGGHTAVGSIVSDTDGTRQASVYFPANTHALLVGANGATTPLTQLTVRATEYTVGQNGGSAMPGALPSTSAYTYAVELSVDEALAQNAQSVLFDQPVPVYVDNFLNMPVGAIVPVGYFDRKLGAWVASDNGLTIKVLNVDSGIAAIDTNGDGLAESDATLTAFGITLDERISLAQTRGAGVSIWRFATRHFTPWDCNWPYRPWTCDEGGTCYGDNPGTPKPSADTDDCQKKVKGSIIECQSQVLRETLPIPGTPFSLNYRSGAMPGYQATSGLDIPVVGARVPSKITGVDIAVVVGGQGKYAHYTKAALEPNLGHHYSWDGHDAFGRAMQGKQSAKVVVSYAFTPPYAEPGEQNASFGSFPSDSILTMSREAVQYRVNWVYDLPIGQLREPPAALGGWLLSGHMHYDVLGRRLLTGAGEEISVDALTANSVPRTFEKYSSYSGCDSIVGWLAASANGDVYIREGDYIQKLNPSGTLTKVTGGWSNSHFDNEGKPAISSLFSHNLSVAVGPDGSLFVSDRDDNRVWRIGLDGILHTVAGKLGPYQFTSSQGIKNYGTVAGYTGDGGLATDATLNAPLGVAVAADGTVYVADAGNYVIRRIDPAGRISTVAGTGAPPPLSGNYYARPEDGLPARATAISNPNHVVLAPDGSLYFDSQYKSYVLSRLGVDGKVHYVTGNDELPDFSPAPEIAEGVPAFTQPSHTYKGFSVDSQGRVYFADSYTFKGDVSSTGQYRYVGTRIREVSNSGLINTIAGENWTANTEYHRPAIRSFASRLLNLSVLPDQSLVFVGDCSIDRLRTFPVLTIPGCNYLIPSADASQLYCFDASGRHLKTLEPKTLAPLYTFGYANELLSSVTDGNNNVTSITRDGTLGTIEITGPFGQKTTIKTDSGTGYATKITFPDSTAVTPEHQPNGLLTALVDARNNRHIFQYDELGRLKRDENPAGGYQTLTRTGDTVSRKTALGRETRYTTTSTANGSTVNVSQAPDGAETTTERRSDLTNRTVYADGTIVDTTLEPDPLFGEAALYEQSRTVTMPSGLKNTSTLLLEATPGTIGGVLSSKVTRNRGTGNETLTFDGSNAANLSYVVKSPAGRQATVFIDSLGRTTKVVVPGLADGIFDYDSAGRPWHATHADRVYQLSYRTSSGAADNGYLRAIDDPNGKSSLFERDAFGRVKSFTDPQSLKTKIWYDDAGNLTFLQSPQSVGDSTNILHSLTSNKMNALATYTPPVVPPLLPTPSDVQTSMSFDSDEALLTVDRPGGIGLVLEHDVVSGKLGKIRGPSGDTSVEYYPKAPCPVGCSPGAVRTLTSPNGQSLTFAYDGPLLKSVAFAGVVGATVAHEYDVNFRAATEEATAGPRSSKLTYGYDVDNLLTCVSLGSCSAQDAGALRITRGILNPLLSSTSLEKVADSYTFSEFGELRGYSASFKNSATVTTPLLSITYDDPLTVRRDTLGRVLKQVETIEGVQHTTAYSYYDAGWLHTVQRDGVQTVEYTYDANGNRLTRAAGETAAVYDNQDRLVSSGTSTFEYTPDGEVKTQKTGSSETKYAYDEYRSLQKVTLPNGSEVKYASDAFGRRVQRQIGNQYTRWVYSGSHIIAELDSAGALVSRFIYGSRANVPDAVVKYSGSGTKTYRILSDQAGSPRLVINVNDQTDRPYRASYDEFGVVTGSGLSFIPFGFAGGLYDEDTGLLRFGARDYDPSIGRWLSKDPSLFRGGFNLYAYSNNDPVNYIDTDGKHPVVIVVAAFVAVFLADNQREAIRTAAFQVAAPFLGAAVGKVLAVVFRTGRGVISAAAGRVACGGAAEETVSVFHGSISNGANILEHGLDAARAPTFVSRDLAAAQNALTSHPDAIPGLGTIIESRIPASQFQSVLAPLERPYSGFFPYGLQSTEITLRTGEQIQLFNNFIVR